MIKKYTCALTTFVLASSISISAKAVEWINSKDAVGNIVAYTISPGDENKSSYLMYTRIDGDEELQLFNSDTYYLRNGDEITVNIDIEGMEQSYSLDGSISEGMLVITELANYREMKGLFAQMKMAERLQLGYSFQSRDDGEKGELLTCSVKFSLDGSNDAITEASYN